MPTCDLPFIPDVSPQPCYCTTQLCLNNIPGHGKYLLYYFILFIYFYL
jgi:hypothetical protein